MQETKNCSTCAFWWPTEANDRFGADVAVTGVCGPAETNDNQAPLVLGWPAAAIAWDESAEDSCAARLVTASTFSCCCWREAKPGGVK